MGRGGTFSSTKKDPKKKNIIFLHKSELRKKKYSFSVTNQSRRGKNIVFCYKEELKRRK
jgi:hypothetical protein